MRNPLRAVFQSGNFILGQEQRPLTNVFFPVSKMSISQDLLQSKFHVSALPNWYTGLIPRFSRDVIVYHASRLPALNILDKLIKVDTIGRCPIQSLNGTEVFFSVYSHYDSSSQHMSPRSKKISKKL